MYRCRFAVAGVLFAVISTPIFSTSIAAEEFLAVVYGGPQILLNDIYYGHIFWSFCVSDEK